MKLVARGQVVQLSGRPLIMGIVNLIADSFSGDGFAKIDDALAHARALVRDGADIIDIGAESARTNRGPISEAAESAQLCRFIERWNEPVMLSINTWRPSVARAALAVGGHILNDMSGLPDPANASICAEQRAALVIMHLRGEPKVAHTHIRYDDVISALQTFFVEKIAIARAAGVSEDAIILDPGIDFAKQRADNLRILRELDRFRELGRPILLAVSRKTVIGEVLQLENAAQRDAGSVACVVQGMVKGAAIVRVHNVRAAAQTVRIIERLQTEGRESRVEGGGGEVEGGTSKVEGA